MPGFGRTQACWVRKEPKRVGFAYKPSTLGFLVNPDEEGKAKQGSCWVTAGVGFDFSISNARFLQVLGSFASAGFDFEPSGRWV
ncbi:hypothetical protein SLEP1_g4342 [Rubroshorea leprosula]|uniref:Uncharacterized protein n=1 Tax=Rubroshorea leprosula TaxID=152421 RepID=A0AAV5HND4_9ROSI|nr:hypothetical protein SLEP1_g4342 [Rubroshorea leprosula]